MMGYELDIDVEDSILYFRGDNASEYWAEVYDDDGEQCYVQVGAPENQDAPNGVFLFDLSGAGLSGRCTIEILKVVKKFSHDFGDEQQC